ncbi:sister chromatid cohesion protein 1 [Gonapodya sp. JEL0774]|nr:sister chromatid cohesion protein 1 [Gonapodya sp. JEL0774]
MSRRGPLARIWLAAHWEKKLTKPQVIQTSIETAADAITDTNEPLTLRHSGQLLLGVVKIYSKKAVYLLNDCTEAIAKLKSAFKPGAVDLPDDHAVSALNQITLQAGPTLTAADMRLGEPGFIPTDAWGSRPSQSQDQRSMATPGSQEGASSSQRRGGKISIIDQFQPTHDIGIDEGFDPLALGGDDDLFLEGERKRPSKKKKVDSDALVGTPEEPELGRNASLRREDPVSPMARLGGKQDDSMEIDGGDDRVNFSFLDDTRDQGAEWNGGMDVEMDMRPDDEYLRGEGDTSGLLFDLPNLSETRKKAPAQQGQRKRKLVVDDVTELKSAVIHAQLKDTSDILQRELYAPASDRWLHLPERPSPHYYLTHPAEDRMPPELLALFSRDLKAKMAQKQKETQQQKPLVKGVSTPGKGAEDFEANKENLQPGAEVTFDMDFGGLDMGQPLEDEPRAHADLAKVWAVYLLGSSRTRSLIAFVQLVSCFSDGYIVASAYEFDESEARTQEGDGKGISKNAQKVIKIFKSKLEDVKSPPLSFKAMTKTSQRADIATMFHEILVLKTYDIIDCKQKDAFADIEISARPKLFQAVV